MQYADLGVYLFASVQNGMVGSLYYENGRIRLVHKYGPCIEMHDKQNRLQFIINKKHNWKDFHKKLTGTMNDICKFMLGMDSYMLDTSSVQALDFFPKEKIYHLFLYGSNTQLTDYYLFELFFLEGQLVTYHSSRGYPDTSIHYGNKYTSQLAYVFDTIQNDEILKFAQCNVNCCEAKQRIDVANTELYFYCESYMPTLKLYNPKCVCYDSVIQDYI